MKYHLTGYGVSALLHAVVLLIALPVLVWQDDLLEKSGKETRVNLSLSRFAPAPPEPSPPVQQETPPLVPPVPQPGSKPVAQSKSRPEKPLLEKPKPRKKQQVKPKPVKKPKPRPEKKVAAQPKPAPQTKPVQQRQAQPVKPVTAPARPSAPVRQAAPASKLAKPAPPRTNPAAEVAYKQKLQNLIAARKKYPRQAVRAEVEGRVVVAFTVMPNGAITAVRVRNSSGNDWLDKAAVQAVKAASGALPFPPEIRRPNWPFSLTVNFALGW